MARRTFRYSSTVKMPPPSLTPERAKVAEFYSAGSGTIPPLPWQTFPPPFSALRQCSARLDHTGIVDQNIGLSEAPNRLTDRRLHRGVLRDIAGHTAGLPDLVVDGVGNL